MRTQEGASMSIKRLEKDLRTRSLRSLAVASQPSRYLDT